MRRRSQHIVIRFSSNLCPWIRVGVVWVILYEPVCVHSPTFVMVGIFIGLSVGDNHFSIKVGCYIGIYGLLLLPLSYLYLHGLYLYFSLCLSFLFHPSSLFSLSVVALVLFLPTFYCSHVSYYMYCREGNPSCCCGCFQ